MSYNKTSWISGDIISAEKMNKLENGLESVSNNCDELSTKTTSLENKLNDILDDTLTDPNKAAQAKKVGDKIDELKEDLDDHKDDTTKHITSAERTKWNKNTTDIVALNEALANMQGTVVDSVEEMTDTTKKYVLKSTGRIWEYANTTSEHEVTVTEEIVDTEENPYYDNVRFGSSGATSTQAGYVVTPYIDLTKEEYAGKTIELHLEGAKYGITALENYIMTQLLDKNKNVLSARCYTIDNTTENANSILYITTGIGVNVESETSTVLTIEILPIWKTTGAEIGYLRCCGFGTSDESNVYITYTRTETVTGSNWVDTGVEFGYILGTNVDEETLAKISALNNEGTDPATVKLLAAPVLEFYNSDAYSDDDYTTSHLDRITYPCRADIPVPYVVKWNHNEDAMRTTLAVDDTKPIGTLNRFTMRTYDVTGLDRYPIYNLIPNKTYYYKVTHILADGSIVEAKSGSFTTSSETIRLIYIDGTQNVRDLGGWTGLDGATVKYGKIFRGAAFSDSSFPELILTGKGRRALGDLDVQAELNLGAADTETSIAANCTYTKIGYSNYAAAITGETYRGHFKTALEWIVECLTASKPIYMHCQGGCDRTGTLSFQLLGLLGVSESDLAKEYELSSFSDIGFGRLRTTTKAVDVYDYVGMVEALKAYSGSTITDKFYDFATTGCGISADTIEAFRNLMLE